MTEARPPEVGRPGDPQSPPGAAAPGLLPVGATRQPQWGPFGAAVAVAVLGVGAILVGAATGWLGPDIGRGSGFCEAARDCWIKQPANTWSNLGFVAAGLAIAWRARRPDGRIAAHPWVSTAYALLVVLLGPASMAMHATQSDLGGRLDMLSMYLVASFACAYAAMRVLRAGAGTFAVVFGLALTGCEVLDNLGLAVPVIDTGGNLAFASLLLAAVVLEVVLHLRGEGQGDFRYAVAALVTLLVSFGIWNLSRTDGPWCDPHSLLQGHLVWHLLDAWAAWLLHRYWRSIPTGSHPTPTPTPRTNLC